MTNEAIKQLQTSLGLTPTGVMDTATYAAMTKAVTASVSSNPGMQQYLRTNSVDSILNGFFSNDLSGITNITGRPFSRKEQGAAVAEAERALNPGFREEEAFDQSVVTDTLRGQQEDFGQFQQAEEEMFGDRKEILDQNAADQGVLFSGSRKQKETDLRNTFQDREAIQRGRTQDNIRTTARNNQFARGNQSARGLSEFYDLPGQSRFNAGVAGGQVSRPSTLSSAYNPSEFNFGGIQNKSNNAAIQQRAAGTLSNTTRKKIPY